MINYNIITGKPSQFVELTVVTRESEWKLIQVNLLEVWTVSLKREKNLNLFK